MSSKIAEVVSSIQSLNKKSSIQTLQLNQFVLLTPAETNTIVKVIPSNSNRQSHSFVAKIQSESFSILRHFPDLQITNIFHSADRNIAYFTGMFNTNTQLNSLIPSVYGNWNIMIGFGNRMRSIPSIGSNKVNRIIAVDKFIYITGFYIDSITFDGSYFYNKNDQPTFYIACYNIETDEWIWAKNAKHQDNGASSGIDLFYFNNRIRILIEYKDNIAIDTIPEIQYSKHNHVYAEFDKLTGEWLYVMETKCKTLLASGNDIYLIGDTEILVQVGDKFTNIINQEMPIKNVYIIGTDIYYFGDRCMIKHMGDEYEFPEANRVRYFFIDELNYYSFIIETKEEQYKFQRRNCDFCIVYETVLNFGKITKNRRFDVKSITYVRDSVYSKIHFLIYYPSLNESQLIEYTMDDRWIHLLGIIKSDNPKVGGIVSVEFPGILSNDYSNKLEVGKEYFIQNDATIATNPNKYYFGTAISNYKMIHC